MDQDVKMLYEYGETRRLMAIASRASDPGDDRTGAYLALRLLARLGDPDAAGFCAAAPPPPRPPRVRR